MIREAPIQFEDLLVRTGLPALRAADHEYHWDLHLGPYRLSGELGASSGPNSWAESKRPTRAPLAWPICC